nr:cellulase family glycosylhydrolase [Actinopolymorpha pittospori]
MVAALVAACAPNQASATDTGSTGPLHPEQSTTADATPSTSADPVHTESPDPVETAAQTTGPPGPLHAEGSQLVDARGDQVTLTGVNWFGFETGNFVPSGLGTQNWQAILDQMVATGFNTLRLPYTNQLFAEGSKPSGIDYGRNPDLQGLSGLALMDKIVKGATDRGLMVLLDQHRPDTKGQGQLWYTPTLSENKWIQDWTMLARHYRDNPLVIGADLHNEPHDPATWGSGNKANDWRLAAERAGNAVLTANPNWLIVVEGISDGYWWGGNLTGAKDHPVRLSKPDKLVYSAHDYGPSVWQQTWFKAKNFPDNMPALWKKEWAYLAMDNTAPVLMGEFGGRSVDPNTVEGKWQRKLLSFLEEEGISYTYWAWNPDSEDTGGIVQSDWKTVDQAKLSMLKGYQAPLLKNSHGRPAGKPAPTGSGTYVVQPGDTLDGIARANHVTGGWQTLWNLNRDVLKSPEVVVPNQRLRLR